MRYLYGAIAVVFIFSGVAIAQQSDQKTGMPPARQAAPAAAQGEDKEIVTDYNDESSGPERMQGGREMPRNETYDPNTGLPDVVPSDKEGEIE